MANLANELFQVICSLEAVSAQSRLAERVISAEHQPLISVAFADSLTLCEDGLDAAYGMLGAHDLLRTFSAVEVLAASPLTMAVPSSDYAAIKTILRGLHEVLQQKWSAVSVTGTEAMAASAFATAHQAMTLRLGFTNGQPGIA